MKQRNTLPLHVGGQLAKLMKEHRVSTDQLAKATGLTPGFITYFLTGEQILTADVAFRLADFFEMSPLHWLDLQRSYYLAARNAGVLVRA